MLMRLILLIGLLLAGEYALAQADETQADFEGLPPGVGREAVYFNCTACHSVRQFNQQQLDRDAWDKLLDVMVEKNGMAPLKPWARTLVLNYLSTHFGREDSNKYAGLPPGEGREEVFGICQACHSLQIVQQQRLDRKAWAKTLQWMKEEQGMPDVGPEMTERIVNYLATYFSPTTPR